MAEVRLYLRRGTYGFGHKICNLNILVNQRNTRKGVKQATRLSAGFLLADIQNGSLCGAEKTADTLTVELSQSREARAASPCASVWNVGDVGLSYVRHGSSERTFYAFSSTLRRRTFDSAQLSLVRAYSGSGTRSEPLYKTKTGYYEVLEVAPTATQAQIKTAYYKQSFIYHPDRNCSEEATTRFSDISEAYTVLGSKALRKKYDRGLLSQSDLSATARPPVKDATGSPTKQQHGSRRPVAGQGIRGGIFDFDTFYKSHYNEQLQRQRDIRVRKEEMLNKEKEPASEKQLGRMQEVAVGMLLVTGLVILISIKSG